MSRRSNRTKKKHCSRQQKKNVSGMTTHSSAVTKIPPANPLLLSTVIDNLFTNTSLRCNLPYLKNFRLVCSVWNNVIERKLSKDADGGKFKPIKVFKNGLSDTHSSIKGYHSFCSNLAATPKHCYTNFTFENQLDTEIGDIGTHIFNDFIHRFGNRIRHLVLPINLPLGQFPTILNWLVPNLENLEIHGIKTKPKHISKYFADPTKNSIQYFFNGNLRLKTLHYHQNWENEDKIIRDKKINLLVSLLENSPLLETFVLDKSHEQFTFKLFKTLKSKPKLTSNLKVLRLNASVTHTKHGIKSSLSQLLECEMKNLKVLEIYGTVYAFQLNDVKLLLEKIAPTLEKLSFSTETHYYEGFDLQLIDYRGPICFPTMENLVSLSMDCVGSNHPITFLDFLREMPNLQSISMKFSLAQFNMSSLKHLSGISELTSLKMSIYSRSPTKILAKYHLNYFLQIPKLREFMLHSQFVCPVLEPDLDWLKQKMEIKGVNWIQN